MKHSLKLFKALSDGSRLRIVKMLEVKPLCVCEITAILGLATSTVSKHLSILKEAGIVEDFKDGKWVNYQLNSQLEVKNIDQLLGLIESWFSDDPVILNDRSKTVTVSRSELCQADPK